MISGNLRPMLCAQKSGIAGGQTLRVAKRKCIWCYAVSPLIVVAFVDIFCQKRRWQMSVRWNFKFLVIDAKNSIDNNYSSNLGMNVGTLDHCSYTWRDIYEYYSARPQSALCQGHPTTILENICSEDDLWSRIFGTLIVVKFLACLPLLGFSNF